MEEDTLKKFRAQIEILSGKDIEKVVKRLDKEELNIFIEIMERYNLELQDKLACTKRILQQELKNHEILLKNVWSIIPDELKEHLAEHFDTVGNFL